MALDLMEQAIPQRELLVSLGLEEQPDGSYELPMAASNTRVTPQRVAAEPGGHAPSAALVRQVEDTLRVSRALDLPIEHIGYERLFDQPREYWGPNSKWVTAPLELDRSWTDRRRPQVPHRQLKKLAGLDAHRFRFPALYEAHEFERGRGSPGSKQPRRDLVQTGRRTVSSAALQALRQPPPPPRRVVETSARLGTIAQSMNAVVLGAAALIGGAAVAAAAVPALAVSALAELDPILFGVQTADGRVREGDLAAWFVLAHWDW